MALLLYTKLVVAVSSGAHLGWNIQDGSITYTVLQGTARRLVLCNKTGDGLCQLGLDYVSSSNVFQMWNLVTEFTRHPKL